MDILSDCNRPLGFADGRINDSQITASSVYNNDSILYGPGRARLNGTGGYRANPWGKGASILSAEFDTAMIITGIATQGYSFNKTPEWTEKYILSYSFRSNQPKFFQKSHSDSRAKVRVYYKLFRYAEI